MLTVTELLLDKSKNEQRVEVVGFFRFGREHVAIYPSREEKQSSNGIWLVNPEAAAHGIKKLKAMNNSMVKVVGTYIRRPNRGAGHFNIWPAEIRAIIEIETIDL